MRNTSNKSASHVDVLYVITILVAFSIFHFVSNPSLHFVLIVLVLSILLDWRSAEVTLSRNQSIFFFSDLISVYNYISLLLALTFPAISPEPFSRLIWIHYFFVFAIYIGWNFSLLIVEHADKTTKRFFVYFSIAESLGLIIPAIIFVPFFKDLIGAALHVDILNYSEPLIVILSSYHLLIIFAFVYVTYFMKLKQQAMRT